MVDEHLTDLAAGVHGDERVDGCVTRIGVQACGQRPALGPSPGSVVDLKCCPEQWPGLRGKEIPRDHQVAGGVSGTKSGEVDDGAELSAADQQVAEVKIATKPDWARSQAGARSAASHTAVIAGASNLALPLSKPASHGHVWPAARW